MAICTYPVSRAELAARLMPRNQREALAPFPRPREHRAPWGLTRAPLDFRSLTADGWTQKIELDQLGEVLPPPPRAPALTAPRAAAAARAQQIFTCPESLAYTIWHDTPNTQPGFSHESAGPVPWPFEIAGIAVSSSNASVGVVHWGLFTNDARVRGLFTNPLGTPLSEIIQSAADDKTLSHGGNYLHFSETGSVTIVGHDNLATSLVGVSIRDPGKYLTLIVGTNVAADQRIGVTITVRRICETPIEMRGTAFPQPRAAPAPRLTQPAPPAPPRPRPPPSQAHTSFGARGPVWGPGGGNPTPWKGWTGFA